MILIILNKFDIGFLNRFTILFKYVIKFLNTVKPEHAVNLNGAGWRSQALFINPSEVPTADRENLKVRFAFAAVAAAEQNISCSVC